VVGTVAGSSSKVMSPSASRERYLRFGHSHRGLVDHFTVAVFEREGHVTYVDHVAVDRQKSGAADGGKAGVCASATRVHRHIAAQFVSADVDDCRSAVLNRLRFEGGHDRRKACSFAAAGQQQ
jgi:hypothetical protein